MGWVRPQVAALYALNKAPKKSNAETPHLSVRSCWHLLEAGIRVGSEVLLFLILNCFAHSQAEIHLFRLPCRREPRVTLGPYLEALVGTWRHTSGVEAVTVFGGFRDSGMEGMKFARC